MSESLTAATTAAVLDHLHGVATLTITGPLKLALFTDIPDDDNPGIEVTGGSYARQNITMGAAGNRQASNVTAPTFTMPAVTVYGFKIYDSSTPTPRAIWQGALSLERTFTAGDTATFAAGDIVVSVE